MVLSTQDLQALCQLAIKAATMAGTLISQRTNEKLIVQNKSGGTSLASQVFTEVDIASEQLIIETLNPSLKQYDLALLSEETPDDRQRFEKDYFWCIDPLDGTLPFIEQQNGYSVSIALVAKDGTPVIGVIFDPKTSNLYYAIKDKGAYKNNSPWMIENENNCLTLVCDRSFFKHAKYGEVISKLKHIFKEELQVIKHGGAAMNAIWVIENHPAIYMKFPKQEDGGGSLWDYAATTCIYNELGASATDFWGKDLMLNSNASTFMNKKGIYYCSSIALYNKTKALFT